MSRGELDNSTLVRIQQELPGIENLRDTVLGLYAPDFISAGFAHEPESDVPVAAACLYDGFHVLNEARHALHEVFAHRIWYREKSETPNEEAAIVFCRFYVTDVAFRLYTAAEHLANAIIFMLEITDHQLEKYRECRTSQQSIVGNFLVKEKPHHPVTAAVRSLAESQDWKDAMNYRNNWVHEQPPTVQGLGITYRRTRRWRPTDEGYQLGIGGGDEPEYSIDDLLRFIRPVLFRFAETMTTVVQFYVGLLKKHGITITTEGRKSSLQIHYSFEGQ